MQRVTDTVKEVTMRDVGSPALANPFVGPFLVPAILATGFKMTKEAQPPDTLQELPFAIHFRYGVSLAPVYDMEFAFPITLYSKEEREANNGANVTKSKQIEGIQKLLTAVHTVIETAKKWANGGT